MKYRSENIYDYRMLLFWKRFLFILKEFFFYMQRQSERENIGIWTRSGKKLLILKKNCKWKLNVKHEQNWQCVKTPDLLFPQQ